MELQNVVIVDGVRSAFGRGAKGSLTATRMDELAGKIVSSLLERNSEVDAYEIEDVIAGNVLGGADLTRMASNPTSRLANLPPEVSHVSVNRQCGSSMQALHMAARSLMVGDGDVAIAMGVERMGRGIPAESGGDTPLTQIHPRMVHLTDQQKKADPLHSQRYSVPFADYLVDSPANPSMPQTAQNVAEAWNLSRVELDEYALRSHETAAAATKLGLYKDQIIPIAIKKPVFDAAGQLSLAESAESVWFEQDECIRPTTNLEKLQSLAPLPMITSYGERQLVITAGNSCPTNDGVSALLLMNEQKAHARHLKPLARIKAMATCGVKPQMMGIGTIPASQKALQRAGISAKEIGLAEINEAFASQALITVKELGIDPQVVNVNGGAIAIGHPLGASGGRLLVGLAHEMRRRGNVRYGLATMCIGAGMGIATILEAID